MQDLNRNFAAPLEVISDMFYDPTDTPCPVGANLMPTATESLNNKLEANDVQYSPALWADPLLTYALGTGQIERVNNDMNAVGVVVTCDSGVGYGSGMELSMLGLQIKAILDANISESGAIKNTMQMAGLKDQQSIASIMQLTDHTSSGLLDEAAIVRLFMLQAITTGPWQQVCSSSTPYLYAVNVVPDRKTCDIKWTTALDTSDELQIGTATSTSTLFFRTLDEYAALIAGNKDKDMVYIPVKSCWRGQSWLMPYILSFTTTAWWNHACRINVTMKNLSDAPKIGQTMKLGLMPRAATVYIPGSFENICLVVVDATSQTFPSAQPYNICPGIAATRTGNNEFAKLAHAYLGRATVAGVATYLAEDITNAMNHMCVFMATRQEYRRLHLRSAVLATSRYNGFGIYPNPEKPPTATGADESARNHIQGLYQFDSKAVEIIGDLRLTDICTETEETPRHILYNRNNWRTDPLGYFAYGNVDVNKDGIHAPAMWKHKHECMQYQLTEASNNIRILRACGVYKIDPDTATHKYLKPNDVFNTTLAYGSLLLGLTNWAAVEMGITMFEHNRMGKRQKCIHPSYHQLWPQMTHNFVVRSSSNRNRVVDITKMPAYMGISMNLAVMTKNIPMSWLDTHYSWNVPWWFVSAIAAKFGHKFNVKTPPNTDYCCDWDADYPNSMMGYLIEHGATSEQADLSMLTSSCQYEKRVRRNKPAFFEILTPSVNGKDEVTNMISFDLNAFSDATKHNIRFHTPSTMENLDGVCELNVVVFPSMRATAMKTFPRCFVTADNRVDPRDESTYPYITGGLRYPNPGLKRLLKGEMAVVPSLLATTRNSDEEKRPITDESQNDDEVEEGKSDIIYHKIQFNTESNGLSTPEKPCLNISCIDPEQVEIFQAVDKRSALLSV